MKAMTVAIYCGFLGVASLAHGQAYGPTAKGKMPRIELEGKLQAWQGGMMQIINDKGQTIAFALPQSPGGVRFEAAVDKGLLRKGMMVRIQAPIGPNGQFLEAINSLEIFVPDISKVNARNSMIERSMNVPGIYKLNEIVRPAQGSPGIPDVRIVGAVVGLNENLLALQCGNQMMKIELSEKPKIEYNSPTLEYAKQGDRVRGGGSINPATNQIVATSISVRAAKPLTAPAVPEGTSSVTKLRVKETPKSKLKMPELTEPSSGVKTEGADKPVEPGK